MPFGRQRIIQFKVKTLISLVYYLFSTCYNFYFCCEIQLIIRNRLLNPTITNSSCSITNAP